MSKTTHRIAGTHQRGTTAIAGVGVITLLLLIAIVIGYFALTSKSKTTLVAVPPMVSADDSLTQGKTNNELQIDGMIIAKAINRDEDQRKATQAVLADVPQPVGDGVTTDTAVEAARLSSLQTEFISESDRRIKILNDLSPIIDKLTASQKTLSNQIVSDEITALTGLKAKAAAETTTPAFLADRAELDKEYINFTLAAAQARMLLWGDDQAILYEKVNLLGGKFQERLNEASDKGTSVADAQITLNSFQTNKTTVKTQTTAALAAVTAVKPNTFNANRAVLKSYYDQLASSHNELVKALSSAKELVVQIRAFK